MLKIKPVLLFILCLSFCSIARSQYEDKVLSGLENKFINYVKAFPREEVFTHTDREEYIAGEETFFAVYIIDRQTLKPSVHSRIAYIELWNSQNVPVIQKRILISNGTGSGSFTLPDTLHTGVYRLRVYTSWMKNFLPDNCFLKEIQVYNLLRDEKPGVMHIAEGKKNQLKKLSYLNSSITITVGCLHEDSLMLNIVADSLADYKQLHVIIQTRGNIDFKGTYPYTGKFLKIAVPASEISPGINQITLFNAQGIPVAERFIFTRPRYQAITMHSENVYKTREQINLSLEMQAREGSPSFFSISVAPGIQNFTDIMDYMIVGTEFGFRLGDIPGGDRINLIENFPDSLLNSLSSTWIDWPTIISGNYPQPVYPMEKENHILKGVLKDAEIDTAQFILICRPGKNAGFRYTKCNFDGRFSFPVEINTTLKDYVIMPDSATNSTAITIESPFVEEGPFNLLSQNISGSIPPYIPKWSINYQVRKLYEISDTIGLNANNFTEKVIRFYGKPDFELIMSDYISLPLMEEVFYEILPYVSIRKRESGNQIIITDRIDNRPFVTIPCLMIDGVIINDPDLIIDMDPELVEKIDVIKENYFVGKFVFPGIVNVITKKGDFSAAPLPDYMTRISYLVADRSVMFNSPSYDASGEISRIPDYRNTLYWKVLSETDKSSEISFSFYSSDIRSDYTILVYGISNDGTMYSLKRKIRVR
jgi:hypothetical protein